MNDDDEDSCGNIGTNRYQATPSLQALQQMRNRLHTAYLGKRLMKWTALATSKELRRIAEQITIHQEITFVDLYQLAVIQLARCRFHNTEFHKTLIENVGHKAHIRCETTNRFVAGVKVTVMEMITDGPVYEPYSCIGRGGEILAVTRQTWEDLIKSLVNVTQLRISFNSVFKSNREATKKQNVMGKIIIPKTKNTIRYILNELEEIEREDFFRLKKIQKLKGKRNKPSDEKRFDRPKDSQQNVLSPIVSVTEALKSAHKVLSPIVSISEALEMENSDKSVEEFESMKEYEPTCEACKSLIGDLINYVDKVIVLSKAMDEASPSNNLSKKDVARFIKLCLQMKNTLNSPSTMCENCNKKHFALVPYDPLQEKPLQPKIPLTAKALINLGPCTSVQPSTIDDKSQANDSECSAGKTQSMISTRVTKLNTLGSKKIKTTVSCTIHPSTDNQHKEFIKRNSFRIKIAKRGVLLLPMEVSNFFANKETKK